MAAKKKAKNAFILFVNDWRKRQTNNLSWEESITQAGLDWVKMSDEKKLRYKMEAARSNQGIKATTQSSPIKQAQQPKPLTPEEEEQLKAKRHIDKMVNDSVESIELETEMYCFIMVNYFAKTTKSDMYQPAELAMAEFSLQEGVRRLFHKLINPGSSVYGSEFVTKTLAKETHQLPIPPNALGEDDLMGLFKDILQFLEHKNEYRPIFTTTERIPIVSGALKYLNGGNHELKVYPIEYLYFVLKKSSCQISGMPLPKSLFDTSRIFERDLYQHEANISCDFHEPRDLSKYCAKSCVTRWGFMFANFMCYDLAITMLPNRHKPEIMPIPTIIPKMKGETKQEIEEPKKDKDIPTTPTPNRIKTERPEIEENDEDFWKDLNNLTEIIEEEIGRIKTEIDDSDENEANLAAPPPPPISLGEIHDELALFTRRMRTTSERSVRKEEKSKEMSSKATKSKSDQNSLKSKSKTDKKSSKSKGKHEQKSSKSKSDHISRHVTRETERRSSRHRSRRGRKVSRSRSKERKPHRNENSSSRHFRKSVSPRARGETISRTNRRISRSKSRDLISHRRRTYSKETSKRHSRRSRSRSRSRSNLRINRAKRRSRSRSVSRYRYSPKRRRSDSFSSIRRRPPLSERLDSPKPNLNLTPSHSHSSTFTNAPSTINYQLPIHAARNPIPTVTPTHYPTHMTHGSMQYSHTTTYSTQYYQANQMAHVPVGGVYKQPLLPAPAVPELHRPYDLRHRLGPPSLPSRCLNNDDLRHRIRGRPEFYGLQAPMYPNFVDYYPPPYMAGPNHYGSYHHLPPNVPH
ncbi:uncharacterized protein [Drosophila tropicalis]|uniref:uncharacterized protein n=1 Tax=Drosophila tropicalis TaxID=46794 RepID=UPI0035AC25D7